MAFIDQDLTAFFKENFEEVENTKYYPTKRLKVPFELKVLDGEFLADARKKATIKKMNPKTHTFDVDFNYDIFADKVAVASVVVPDLTNKALQDNFGVVGEVALLKAMLNKGDEYSELVKKCVAIQEQAQGDYEEKVEEAKN